MPSDIDSDRNLPFTEHLEELRSRLIKSLVWFVILTAVGCFFAPYAIELIISPLRSATNIEADDPQLRVKLRPTETAGEYWMVAAIDNFTTATERPDLLPVRIVLPDGRLRPIEGATAGGTLVYHGMGDPIWLFFKASMVLGIIFSFPVWAYQTWAFVAPGLKKREKDAVRPLFTLAGALFPVGVLFSFLILQVVITFLLNVQIPGLAPMLEISKYLSFAVKFMLGFGIVFEMPVVILVLARIGIVDPIMLRTYRKHAIVGIAVLSMAMTPPDPFSMMLMMLPLMCLYELGIWLAILAAKRRDADEARWEDVDPDDEGE